MRNGYRKREGKLDQLMACKNFDRKQGCEMTIDLATKNEVKKGPEEVATRKGDKKWHQEMATRNGNEMW